MDAARAIGVLRDRIGRPYKCDLELVEAAMVAVWEIEALRSTVKEYCDSDEVSDGFGSGCFSKKYINEIRRRHGLVDEPKGGES